MSCQSSKQGHASATHLKGARESLIFLVAVVELFPDFASQIQGDFADPVCEADCLATIYSLNISDSLDLVWQQCD